MLALSEVASCSLDPDRYSIVVFLVIVQFLCIDASGMDWLSVRGELRELLHAHRRHASHTPAHASAHAASASSVSSHDISLAAVHSQHRRSDDVEGMSISELRAEVYRLRTELADAQSSLKREQRNRRIAQRRAMVRAATRRDVKRKRKASERSCGLLKRGRGEFFWTDRGGLSLALRRVLSNGGVATLGLALHTDVHRTTVCSWEVKLRAALLESSRLFNRACMQCLELDDAEGWRLAIFQMSGDATNSMCWQKQKLRVAEVEASYLLAPFAEDANLDSVLENLATHRTMGSVQIVAGATGMHTHALATKQYLSTGAAPWSKASGDVVAAILDMPAPSQGDPTAVPASAHPAGDSLVVSVYAGPQARSDPWDGRKVLSIWLSCTDGGADEVMGRRLQMTQALRFPTHWMFEVNCLAHQYQLQVADALVIADGFLLTIAGLRYYSSLAKLMNTWREYAAKIFTEWRAKYGDAAAAPAGKVPPNASAAGGEPSASASSLFFAFPLLNSARCCLQSSPSGCPKLKPSPNQCSNGQRQCSNGQQQQQHPRALPWLSWMRYAWMRQQRSAKTCRYGARARLML